jgi:hypothetical protein
MKRGGGWVFFIDIFETDKGQGVPAGEAGQVPVPFLDGFFGRFDLAQLDELWHYVFLWHRSPSRERPPPLPARMITKGLTGRMNNKTATRAPIHLKFRKHSGVSLNPSAFCFILSSGDWELGPFFN